MQTTKAEKACDYALTLMRPWRHLWSPGYANDNPMKAFALVLIHTPGMILGALIFLLAIWFLPEPPPSE
jgi:hypothetical protein